MAEQAIRWVTAVDPGRLADPRFRQALEAIALHLPFAQLPMLHFASITIFEPKDAPPLLVFESNIDEPLDTYVRQLVNVGRKGLDLIYRGTEGYPHEAGNPEVVRFFQKLKAGTNLYHIGHPNRTVQEIKGDVELRRSITYALENDPALKAMLRNESCADLVRAVRVRAKVPRLWPWERRRPWNPAWHNQSPDPPTALNQIEWARDTWSWPWWFGRAATLVMIAWLIATAFIVVLNPLISPRVLIFLETLAVFVLIRGGSGNAPIARSGLLALFFTGVVAFPFLFHGVPELIPRLWWVAVGVLVVPGLMLVTIVYMLVKLMVSDPKPVPPEVKARIPALLEAEDLHTRHSHYNHVAGLSELKPRMRWLRSLRTRLGLELLNLFYRTEYVKGRLVNIPSIHFAQWSIVNSRYVLFLTNYDGPADSYLDDFFNNLAFGVAFIWQDTGIFPMSIDPRRLKMWVREGQTLATVRYRAPVYQGLTVGAVNNNTFIRKRLLRGRTEASARRWLRRFATTPEEPGWVVNLVKWTKEHAGVRS
ncbi:MAG TPA: hypothetical protein VL914_01285 [Vicinamibacterales bacterium]|jgi:hypothetical protein|nr:hypothetical protein [Vicinamibacterales bacterium]